MYVQYFYLILKLCFVKDFDAHLMHYYDHCLNSIEPAYSLLKISRKGSVKDGFFNE